MKKAKSYIKPLFLAVFLLFSGTTQAGSNCPTVDLPGFWKGSLLPAKGNPIYTQETVLSIAASPEEGPNKIHSTDESSGMTCKSDLIFENVEGNTSTFTADLPSCLTGKVLLTPFVGIQLLSVQMVDENGAVTAAGVFHRLSFPAQNYRVSQ